MNEGYQLPVNVYQEWDGCKREDYAPSDRQMLVIQAVKTALEEKLFYSDDVLKRASKILGVTEEQAASGASVVQGGHFGMECYYARQYIEAQRAYAIDRAYAKQLQPHKGMKLGTLVFNDSKRNTSVEIVEVEERGRMLTLHGKRGNTTVAMTCTATQVAYALDRAAQRELRKDGFAEFCRRCHPEQTEAAVAA